MKWALDNFVSNEEEKAERCAKPFDDKNEPFLSPPLPSQHSVATQGTPTETNDEKSNCSVPLRSSQTLFESGLKDDSHLCFQALQPEEPVKYLDTKEGQNFTSKSFRLTDICICGNKKLEDARIIFNNSTDTDKDNNSPSATFGFFKAIATFQILFVVFAIVNLPLLAFKLYPASADLQNVEHDIIPRIQEEQEQLRNSANLDRYDSMISAACNSISRDPCEPDISLSHVIIEGVNGTPLQVLDTNDNAVTEESSPMVNGAAEVVMPRLSAADLEDEEESVTQNEDDLYTPLDSDTPSLSLLRIFSMQITWFPAPVNNFLSWLRRFLLFVLASTHIIVFAAILDHCNTQSQKTITKLLAFREYEYQKHKNQIILKDLRFWNELIHSNWNNTYGILLPFWFLCLLLFSQPSFIKMCLREMRPSKYFGVCDISSLWPQSFKAMDDGLQKITQGMELRIGFLFRGVFWKILWNNIHDPSISKRKRVMNFCMTLIAIPTFLPIYKLLTPLIRMFKRMIANLQARKWQKAFKKCAFLISVLFFLVLSGFLVYWNVYIYSMFIVFTLTSIIFHYQQSLNLIGIIAGSVTFILKILSQVKNKYISLKMLTVEVATEIHNSKMEEAMRRGSRTSNSFNAGPPQLIWYASNGIPYIPFKLYQSVMKELKPVGPERAKIVIKLGIMAVFVVYIYTVMRTLRMNEEDAAFNVAQAALTVVAVVIPSLLANLQSEVEKELEKERNRCIIKKMIETFLKENDEFYRFTTT